MTHQQILEKLSAKALVQAVDEDLARLTFEAMCYHKNDTKKQAAYIIPRLMLRWNCVLDAGKELKESYRQVTVVAIAVLLHKYGFADKKLISQALKAIDLLNKKVVLSDAFARQSENIKKLIESTPASLKRKPSTPGSITFYREKDVVSMRLRDQYYGAYIHRLTAPNESPIIELYDGVFTQPPTLAELEKLPAKGQVYNDGSTRVYHMAISGMKQEPDPANQVKLIASNVKKIPAAKHLEPSVGLYAMLDLFSLQDTIISMFSK